MVLLIWAEFEGTVEHSSVEKLLTDAQIAVIKEEVWIKRHICLIFQFDPIPCCVICDDLDNHVLVNDVLLDGISD